MDKVRYAVVGAGWISQEAFIPAVPASGNAVLSAIVSGNAEHARRLAEFHGVPHVYSYERYEEMLAADVVDAVYVALPNSMHADYTIRAARAGKHILVEKPLATTEAECEAMIAAAADAGVFLMAAYRLHCEPGTVALLEEIRAGAIGDPRFFTSTFSFQAAPGNHRLLAQHWGGPLQDIGVYCLNAARHVFAAEPIEAIAMTSHDAGDARFAEVPGTIGVTLRFPEGRMAQFLVSFGAGEMDMYRVVGTEGDVSLEPGFMFDTATRMRLRRGKETTERQFPQIDQFAAQTAYFSHCIQTGTRPEPDGEEGLADVRAMRAIERAAQTGTPQTISTPARLSHPTPDMVRLCPVTHKRLVF